MGIRSWVITGAIIGAITGSQLDALKDAYYDATETERVKETAGIESRIKAFEEMIEEKEPGLLDRLVGDESTAEQKKDIALLNNLLAKAKKEKETLKREGLPFSSKIKAVVGTPSKYRPRLEVSQKSAYGAGIGAGAGVVTWGALALRRRKKGKGRTPSAPPLSPRKNVYSPRRK